MALRYKDYYEILGVSREAGQEEIKRAFRKLARQYHPDTAGGEAGAEERFKEINEAYEVLKDPQKRQKYDALGGQWQEQGGFRPPPRQGAGRRSAAAGGEGFDFNFGGTGFSDFFEAFFGSAGMADDLFSEPGFGRQKRAADRRGGDLEADIMVTLEEAIQGSVRQVSVERKSAPGRAPAVETYQVKIPRGVRQGQRIRLAGKGEAGLGGGAAGDLYLRVRLAEHPDFRPEGSDLYFELELAPWEAVLGTRVEVPTPSGKIALKVPPGTVGGQKFRLRGQGMPKEAGARGDLFAVARIQVPTHLSPKERSLWEELARTSGFRPRD